MKIQETDNIFIATNESLFAFNGYYAYPSERFDTFNMRYGSLGNAISLYGDSPINLIIPAENEDGYELFYGDGTFELDDTDMEEEDKSLFQEIWTCTKEHYGLTTAVAAATVLQMPINKKALGHKQKALGSGKYTNLISHTGSKIRRYFSHHSEKKITPLLLFKSGSPVANMTKSLLGTTRVFGVIGRVMPGTAAVLAVVDITAISYCTYEKNQ